MQAAAAPVAASLHKVLQTDSGHSTAAATAALLAEPCIGAGAALPPPKH